MREKRRDIKREREKEKVREKTNFKYLFRNDRFKRYDKKEEN